MLHIMFYVWTKISLHRVNSQKLSLKLYLNCNSEFLQMENGLYGHSLSADPSEFRGLSETENIFRPGGGGVFQTCGGSNFAFLIFMCGITHWFISRIRHSHAGMITRLHCHRGAEVKGLSNCHTAMLFVFLCSAVEQVSQMILSKGAIYIKLCVLKWASSCCLRSSSHS